VGKLPVQFRRSQNMLSLSPTVQIPLEEIQLTAIRAQGAGGQNVNKVSSAVHLRFDSAISSLPAHCKQRLLELRDGRVTDTGVVVIKAQRHRTQELNRLDALERLADLIRQALEPEKLRRPTRPTLASKRRRLDGKAKRSSVKAGRGRPEVD
jgi:ribosome-associated protein